MVAGCPSAYEPAAITPCAIATERTLLSARAVLVQFSAASSDRYILLSVAATIVLPLAAIARMSAVPSPVDFSFQVAPLSVDEYILLPTPMNIVPELLATADTVPDGMFSTAASVLAAISAFASVPLAAT